MSSGLGPPLPLPEKSGFPEEAFLGRVWCSDRDVMTRSPLPRPKPSYGVRLGPHSQPAYSLASSPAQVGAGDWVG